MIAILLATKQFYIEMCIIVDMALSILLIIFFISVMDGFEEK